MKNPDPVVPHELHPLAAEILELLRSRPEAAPIILGGGVALQHYCSFRQTNDIDAWWKMAPDSRTQLAIQNAMNEVAASHGYSLKVREWGETQSYELQHQEKTIFSFQIAIRTKELDPPRPSHWDPVQIETFRDNLAAKMNAVVSRGAPRDFLDVAEVCQRGLATPEDCWGLWKAKNPELTLRAAKANVVRHLEQLESRRPLASIQDAEERSQATTVRLWLREQLCQEVHRGHERGR